MTNAPDAATAATNGQQPTGDDNGVAAAAAAANAPDTKSLDERIDEILGGRLDQYGRQVKQTIDQAQGRAQQFYGDKLKEDRSELAQFMGDLTQVLDDDQREVLDQLREKREGERLNRRLDEIEAAVKQPPAQPAAQATQMAMSQADSEALFASVEGMIETSGLDIKPSNEKLWAGFKNEMPLQQAISLARKNIKAMRTASAPTVDPSAQPAPTPPSVTGADSVPADTYDSLSDLAAAFRDRQINSTEFSRIGRERNWLR
jgi:hypothetical protein